MGAEAKGGPCRHLGGLRGVLGSCRLKGLHLREPRSLGAALGLISPSVVKRGELETPYSAKGFVRCRGADEPGGVGTPARICHT